MGIQATQELSVPRREVVGEIPADFSKEDIYARLCRPIPFDGSTKVGFFIVISWSVYFLFEKDLSFYFICGFGFVGGLDGEEFRWDLHVNFCQGAVNYWD